MFISEEFGPRTCKNMELALGRACALSPSIFEAYEARKYVAERIRAFVSEEPRSLSAMILVGRSAASEVIVRELHELAS